MTPFKRVTVAAAMTVAALGMALPAIARSNTDTPHQGRTVTMSARKMKTYEIKVRKHGRTQGPKVAEPDAPQAGVCLPPILGFGREDLYLAFPVTVEVLQLEAGAPDGNEKTYNFLVQTQVGLSARSTSFNIDVAVVGLSTSGDDPGLDPSLTITSQCDLRCTDTSPQVLAVGTPQVAAGGASNKAITPADHVSWPNLEVTLYAEYGGDQSSTISWPIVPAIRCDHMYPAAWRKPGCVFPAFIPTVDMSGLKSSRRISGRCKSAAATTVSRAAAIRSIAIPACKRRLITDTWCARGTSRDLLAINATNTPSQAPGRAAPDCRLSTDTEAGFRRARTRCREPS
jgi:hypothetical protein